MRLSLSLWRGTVLLLIVASCSPVRQSTASPTKSELAATPTLLPTTTTIAENNIPSGRYESVNVESMNNSGISGTFTARENGDGTTLLKIKLDNGGDLNPWGIYTSIDCASGVPVNRRPIFDLPDIEAGQKEETVETSTYKFLPGNLALVVFAIAPDGSQQIAACADLGPPTETAPVADVTSTPSSDCDRSNTTAVVSPLVGDWVALSATRNGNGDIYLLNVEAALQGLGQMAVTRLTTNAASDFDATWSPDGTQIAFRSQRDGNDEIYVMNADGTCQRDLTNDSVGDWSPAWSPDGKRIAFARFFDDNQFTDLAVINVDGSGLQRLTTGSGEYPSWSPDGTRIAFATARDGNYEIYVMDADGTHETRLTNNPAYDMSPSWSPDGTHIAFDTQRDDFPPSEVGIGPEFEIHVMNLDGSGDTRLTNNTQEDRFPDWGSNDRLVFTQNGQLVLLDLDGSGRSQVIGNGTFPAWHTFDH
jgi:Tol biopolymer transport system component